MKNLKLGFAALALAAFTSAFDEALQHALAELKDLSPTPDLR